MISLYSSLVSSDIFNLEQNIKSMEPYCQGFHLPIMDFHFVPALEWSIQAVNKIRKVTTKKLHVHLMVEYPENYIPLLDLHPNDILSIHIESPSTQSIENLLKSVQIKQLIPSIALNPYTPIEAIVGIQFPLQHILVTSATYDSEIPQFLMHSLEKIKQLTLFKKSHNLLFDISIDGGITIENLQMVAESHPNEIVLASNLFGYTNIAEKLKIIIDLTKTR